MTRGRLAYLSWYQPVGFVKRVAKHGVANSFLAIRGEREMRSIAATLPVARWRADSGAMVAFLTGNKHWHQTLFCAWSLLQVSGCDLTITVYDDGSLEDANVAAFRRTLPGIQIARIGEIEQTLDQLLPTVRFPVLRQRRLTYLHLRKLTDVHIGRTGPILVLDSDMLFLKHPQALLNWANHPVGGCCLQDCMNSYGYSNEALEELLDGPIAQALNVGVLGLRSEEIDWEQVEFWCATLLDRYGPSYYLEQALSAMLLSQRPSQVLPRSDYIVLPTPQQIASGEGVLQHYVAESKYSYLRDAWRMIGIRPELGLGKLLV